VAQRAAVSMGSRALATIRGRRSSAVTEQIEAVVARLIEIRDARGWGVRRMGQVLGTNPGFVSNWLGRATDTSTLPTLESYARHLDHTVRLLLVEDDPEHQGNGWRNRMPYADNPVDTHAMSEAWRLQQALAQLRHVAGVSRAAMANAIELTPIALWRLETSPAQADGNLTNLMLYARFLGYTLRLQLESLSPEEVTDMGKWVCNDGTVIYDGNTETGDDEQHEDDD
jgi:transcriptional regulator with XRE-family HTH domain